MGDPLPGMTERAQQIYLALREEIEGEELLPQHALLGTQMMAIVAQWLSRLPRKTRQRIAEALTEGE